MTDKQVTQLLDQVAARDPAISPRQAREKLMAGGHPEDEARELVFIALGGGDLVETNDKGQEIYVRSGRRVVDVEAELDR